MKAFITTVAGMATRFSASLPAPVPKCVYTAGKPENTLLYRLVTFAEDFDRIVIVTGFMKDTVTEYAEKYFSEKILNKIIFVNNKEYAEYGSGWSLYLGLKALSELNEKYSEILFAEGDLYFSREDFEKICNSKNDVITVNNEPIEAKKAVALYFDRDNRPHYIYDTSHGILEINEPFTAVYNSAQIWKFCNTEKLFRIMNDMGENAHQGTNLVLMNNYYCDNIEIIRMNTWVNCNTTEDFAKLDFNK